MQMMIRLEGVTEDIVRKLIRLGYFKTKNEIVRLGILEIGKEYDLLPTKEELANFLAAKKMEELEQERKTGKRKTIPLSKMKKKYPELAVLE